MKEVRPLNSKSKNGRAEWAAALVPLVVLILAGVWLLTRCFVVVDSGHVGVVTTLGAVKPKALPEGFHLVKPFIDRVVPIDCRLHRAHSKADAASKDLQMVSTEVTVQFEIIGEVAPQTFQNIGTKDDVSVKLIEPAIQESVKSVTASFTAEQLVTQRQAVKVEIHDKIREFIEVTLREKEMSQAVNIANVAITDFNFSDEFNRAIELKVKAEQEALQAKNEKLKRVTQAEAAASEMQLAADAKAYQITQESVARAEAIKREAAALANNPELVQLRAVERWNGQLPIFSGAGGPLPMLNVESLLRPAPAQQP